MSVRQAFLAMLDEQPMHGYQLRAEFERRTAGTWPLNVGQVYTTLARLERDGLVEASADDTADGTTTDDPRRGVRYRVTPLGREEAAAWFTTPVLRGQPPRDELAIKLAVAVTLPGIDVPAVIQQQRSATMAALQDYTRLKRANPTARADLAWGLVLDSLVFSAEAEIRWLDHCESRLRRTASQRDAASPASRTAARKNAEAPR
jgi:DNA-binding PadR family transcriptional regulator